MLQRADGSENCERLWQLRREFSYSLRDTGLIKLNEDIVVPRGRLEELFAFTARLQKKSAMPIACFGHAGDGNIHVNVMYDDKWPRAASRSRAVLDELFAQVVAWKGVITGEHGVGLAKNALVAPGRAPRFAGAAPKGQKRPGSKGHFESRQIRLIQPARNPPRFPPRRSSAENSPMGRSAITAAAATTTTAAAPLSSAVTATTTTAAATTAAITAAAAAAAGRTLLAGPRLIDRQGAALKVFGVEHLNRLFRVFLGGHFDKRKTSGAPRHPVLHDINRDHNTRLREMILQVVFRCGEG